MPKRALIAFAILPLAACDIFSVEAEVPEMCMTFHDRAIAGVEPGGSFVKSLTVDALELFGPWVELDAQVTEARATLTAKSGVSDLRFLQTVNVVMRGTTEEALLVDCADYACASDGMTSTLADSPPDDVNHILREREINLDVIMTGALPSGEWVVDLEVCVSGVAKAGIGL
jgi:hypothetical protein